MKVIPTIFATSKKQFQERFAKLVPIAENLQIDFMDGKFVKSKSLSLKEIPNLRKFNNKFEAHLMTQNPEKYLISLKKKGFKKIIFHFESTKSPEKIISQAEKLSLQVWLAINPETEIERIMKYKNKVDGILFLGVHPGKEHQKFIKKVFTKIKFLRATDKKIKIQVDGGINEETAKRLSKLKVNFINSGSFVSDSKNPKEAIRKLNQ